MHIHQSCVYCLHTPPVLTPPAHQNLHMEMDWVKHDREDVVIGHVHTPTHVLSTCLICTAPTHPPELAHGDGGEAVVEHDREDAVLSHVHTPRLGILEHCGEVVRRAQSVTEFLSLYC